MALVLLPFSAAWQYGSGHQHGNRVYCPIARMFNPKVQHKPLVLVYPVTDNEVRKQKMAGNTILDKLRNNHYLLMNVSIM